MSSSVSETHIQVIPGVGGGQPHIAGRRIKVRDIAVWHEHQGKSADEISAEYDLDLAEIYAALAYYFDHRDEIERSITTSREYAEGLRTRLPSLLEKKLIADSHDRDPLLHR